MRPLTIAALLLALVACVSTPPPAELRLLESDSLSDLAQTASELGQQLGAEHVWVVLDLDNTLLAMNTELGADQWYDWQKKLQDADPCDPRVVTDRLAVQGALYHLGAMHPTESGLPELVRNLQDQGHPVMVLTARGSDFRLPTFRELRRNGLDFDVNTPNTQLAPTVIPGASRPVLYEDGVAMLAGQHKGRMLVSLLDYLGAPRPHAVVFADDKAYNVQAVAEGLQEAGIGGVLYRYGAEDDRIAAFDGEAAAEAWNRLEPAIQTVQSVMGTDNSRVPAQRLPDECAPSSAGDHARPVR